MMPTTGTVLVYLKDPKPGFVKTRMAATIGPGLAADCYRRWIGEVLGKLQPLRPRVRIIGAMDGAGPEAFGAWDSLVDLWWPQPTGNLGMRLDAGFLHAHNDASPVVAVGTDCLELEAGLVETAFAMLRRWDAVFGPAQDGGYYLVGTSRYLTGFFERVRWSTTETLADHRGQCDTQGWSYGLLPLRHDIDTWDDWVAYTRRNGLPSAVPTDFPACSGA
jgi:rSAM/selenodomain-associated transferase 1